MSNTQPIDLLSEEFADFALDEMETTARIPRTFILKGQEFTAAVLGFGSSYSESGTHTGHMPGTAPIPGERCPACRWADVAILKTTPPASPMYLLALMGKSVVPGEENRIRSVWTTDPEEVLKNLEVPGRDGAPRKIPVPNARAFRYAAYANGPIREVLHEREDEIPNVSSHVG